MGQGPPGGDLHRLRIDAGDAVSAAGCAHPFFGWILACGALRFSLPTGICTKRFWRWRIAGLWCAAGRAALARALRRPVPRRSACREMHMRGPVSVDVPALAGRTSGEAAAHAVIDRADRAGCTLRMGHRLAKDMVADRTMQGLSR